MPTAANGGPAIASRHRPELSACGIIAEVKLIGFLAALTALSSAQDAADPSGVAPTRYEADFTPLPKAERACARLGPVGPFYPQRTVDARRNGEASLECRTASSGTLERCRIISETPSGFDFGAAARVMAGRKRIVIAAPLPPGQTIRVRVAFSLGAADQLPPRQAGIH